MENNKSQFKRTGVLHDGAECIVLEQVTEWDGTPQENA